MATFVIRMGRPIPADEAFLAWTSRDLGRMIAALRVKTNPIDRHFLLAHIVSETYKNRRDPAARRTCREVAILHLAEFPTLAPSLRQEMGGQIPRVPTFVYLATVLTEDGQFDQAVSVCQVAMSHGLHDGTLGGFEGRIARIRNKAGLRNAPKTETNR